MNVSSAQLALQPLLSLSQQLRHHRFAVSPDQTMGFIESIELLGPESIHDIRHAAIALFAIAPERLQEFDAIFQSIFFGLTVAAAANNSEDDVDAFEPAGGDQVVDAQDTEAQAGIEAADAERLSAREFSGNSTDFVLIDFARKAKHQLPQRRSYRWAPQNRGEKIDFRRTLKAAAKYDGEIFELAHLKRKKRQRKILLLIDVSGSMKQRSASSLRFAHTLINTAAHVEVFTLGTRLTRVTTALQSDDVDIALGKVSQLVADFDGGTRIGGALQAYLSIPKYAGFARGAVVLILSDGLERGEPDQMINATQKLSRLAWRLSWLTPLASDTQYKPETEALQRALPYIDQLADGDSVASVCQHVLQLARTA